MEEQQKSDPDKKPSPASKPAADNEYATIGVQFEGGRMVPFIVVAVLILIGAIVLSKTM